MDRGLVKCTESFFFPFLAWKKLQSGSSINDQWLSPNINMNNKINDNSVKYYEMQIFYWKVGVKSLLFIVITSCKINIVFYQYKKESIYY